VDGEFLKRGAKGRHLKALDGYLRPEQGARPRRAVDQDKSRCGGKVSGRGFCIVGSNEAVRGWQTRQSLRNRVKRGKRWGGRGRGEE